MAQFAEDLQRMAPGYIRNPVEDATKIEGALGLKLEMRKRTMPVLVIDHIEEKPTDN